MSVLMLADVEEESSSNPFRYERFVSLGFPFASPSQPRELSIYNGGRTADRAMLTAVDVSLDFNGALMSPPVSAKRNERKKRSVGNESDGGKLKCNFINARRL
jgi:hypothetical protein